LGQNLSCILYIGLNVIVFSETTPTFLQNVWKKEVWSCGLTYVRQITYLKQDYMFFFISISWHYSLPLGLNLPCSFLSSLSLWQFHNLIICSLNHSFTEWHCTAKLQVQAKHKKKRKICLHLKIWFWIFQMGSKLMSITRINFVFHETLRVCILSFI